MTMEELMKMLGWFLTILSKSNVLRYNIDFLSRNKIDHLLECTQYDTIYNVADLYKRRLLEGEIWQPKILDTDETLDKIKREPKSFCRIGDGEIKIMMGESIPFQDFNPELARKMMEILQSDSHACYVAICKMWYTWPKNKNKHQDHWIIINRKRFIDFIDAYANKNRFYLNASFTFTYMEEGDKTHNFWQNHYEKEMSLFRGKKIVIFAGDNILSGLRNNIFARAKSIEIVHCPKRNAFSAYQQIIDKARKYPKDNTILCFILGPTATVAVWDLAHEGYMAWDIGHMAKDYDAYCLNYGKGDEEQDKFFEPD